MFGKCLSYLLVALIALQSVVAIADSHPPHLETPSHADFSDQLNSPAVTDHATPLDSADCNHCCHCHNMAQIFLVGNHLCTMDNARVLRLLDIKANYLSNFIFPSIRPPIV